MNQGWVSIHRKLQDSEIWNLEKFTRGQAWVDMILMANHTDKSFFLRGIEIHVKRGQIARSETSLAEKWKWSRGKLRRFFSWLETRQQIVQQKNKLLSIVTIVNYEEYQQNGTTNGTTNGQQTVQQTDTNNNVNNEDNENNEKQFFLLHSKEVQLSELLFSLMLENNPSSKKPNLQTWAKHIDLAHRVDGRSYDDLEKIIKWCQKDSFWATNILSTQKLRKQFDQLSIKMHREEAYKPPDRPEGKAYRIVDE